jgi:hypothetical protein
MAAVHGQTSVWPSFGAPSVFSPRVLAAALIREKGHCGSFDWSYCQEEDCLRPTPPKNPQLPVLFHPPRHHPAPVMATVHGQASVWPSFLHSLGFSPRVRLPPLFRE